VRRNVYNARLMNLKLPRSYKLLLSLALVAGPFIWLVMTEDGQRRSDLFVLHLLGQPSFNVAFQHLSDAVTEADIAREFPQVAFQCEDRATTFGNRVCVAQIASINELPARYARFDYADGHLSAARLDYRARYHDLLVASLRNGLGEPLAPVGSDVLIWRLKGGVLMLAAKRPQNPKDAAMMWLSPEVATQHGAG